MSEIDLLTINRRTVTAAAGCGKTHLIGEALKRHSEDKPILVLTHTNAGVAALRGRLSKEGVPPFKYRLATIDGWAIRLASTFPTRAKLDQEFLRLTNPRTDYPNIRIAAINLLREGHINDILTASYSRLIVDEYQDCSIRQHEIVCLASQTLPSCVLGDPLQAIFGFGSDALVKWKEQVCGHFPLVGELITPWRWINAGAELLGNWLLNVRRNLLSGDPIDLNASPEQVTWVPLDGVEDHSKLLAAARTRAPVTDGHVLIIGDSINAESRYRIASSIPGAITVEAVDLRDLVIFARDLDLGREDVLKRVADFAQSLMANVGAADLVRRTQSLIKGTTRKAPTQVERVAVTFAQEPTLCGMVDLLMEISKKDRVRVYRPAVLRACIKALQACTGTEGLSFYEAVIRVREQNRMQGWPLPKRAIGSTLLLKGLEAEVAVVLNASDLDARNLYVAMTRGSKALVVCSRTPILNPRR